jgi:hypothetical protein
MAAIRRSLTDHTTRPHPKNRAVRTGSVIAVLLDDNAMMPVIPVISVMMATLDRAGHDDSIRTMMSAAVVVKGNRAVSTVMEALALIIDDPDALMMMSMVGCDDDVSLGCRSYRRHRDEQRQSARDHCFH